MVAAEIREQLHLTSLAVKHPLCPLLYSVSFLRMHGKKAEISTAILEMQTACHCQLLW